MSYPASKTQKCQRFLAADDATGTIQPAQIHAIIGQIAIINHQLRSLPMTKQKLKPIVVWTTSDDRAVLQLLAAELVTDKLAACAQISGPITSVYRWEGRIDSSEEFRLTIKTAETLFPKVETKIREHHNYDVPQIVAVAAEQISDDYLAWFIDALTLD